MPQRKKSKTKKQMKKSINSLWNSLQEEKAKHAKASSIIGHMKIRMMNTKSAVNVMLTRIHKLEDQIEIMQNREEYASEVTARLVKNLT